MSEVSQSKESKEVTVLTVEQMWPVMRFDLTLKRAPTPSHSPSLDWEVLVCVSQLKQCASHTTLFAHKCHLSPQTFVPVRDELFHLCCSLPFLLNIVSILVSFCPWFDIVSVGVAVLFHKC